MKVYITICCKEKTTETNEIPAIERYISNRIDTIHSKSIDDNVDFFILSGKYGLLSPSDKIDWYDKLLMLEDIPKMTDKISRQLIENNVTEIILFANSDWKNYIDVISNSCKLVTLVEIDDF